MLDFVLGMVGVFAAMLGVGLLVNDYLVQKGYAEYRFKKGK